MPDDLNLKQSRPEPTNPGNLLVDRPIPGPPPPPPNPPAEEPLPEPQPILGPPPPPEPPPAELNLNPETPPPSGGSSPEPPLIIATPPSNKFPLKKILAPLAVFLLLVSIPAAIFLVKQRQEVREKAVSPPEIQAGFPQDGFDGNNWNFSGEGCFGGTSPYAQIPPGWNLWELNVNRCVQRETFIKFGTYSVKITNHQDQAKGQALAGIYKSVDFVPNTSYVLRGKSYRFYNRSADFVGFQFCDADSCREKDWRPLYGQHGTGTWYSFQEEVTVPSWAQAFNLFLAGGINQYFGETQPNDVYFDDVELVGVATPSCRQIKAYDPSWNPLTPEQLSRLRPGDRVRFTAQGQPANEFTKARFRVNQGAWQETTSKKPGTEEYYLEYILPANVTNFRIEAEVYHRDQGWK